MTEVGGWLWKSQIHLFQEGLLSRSKFTESGIVKFSIPPESSCFSKTRKNVWKHKMHSVWCLDYHFVMNQTKHFYKAKRQANIKIFNSSLQINIPIGILLAITLSTRSVLPFMWLGRRNVAWPIRSGRIEIRASTSSMHPGTFEHTSQRFRTTILIWPNRNNKCLSLGKV